MRGKFITFEGLDGCGKSTQAERLVEVLRAQGLEIVTAREPGSTEIGEKVRAILVNSKTKGLAPRAELALMFSSRAQLLSEIVKPALAEGKWVICDRYSDSSEAYQGGGRQLGSDAVLKLHEVICEGLSPDLTILMDSDAAASVARARRRNQSSENASDENRFERENKAFFERVHETYLSIAKREPQRVALVDARRQPDVVHHEIVQLVKTKLFEQKRSK